MKEDVNCLQTSKISRMLSETNGMMLMIRQWEQLFCSGKGVWQQWQSRMEELFCTLSGNQLTDDYCDVLLWPDAYKQRHEWWTACKHCFMTLNTISCVSRLIQKCFRQKFLDLFGGVWSLNTCFSLHLFWLLYCITLCEGLGRFYCATQYNYQVGQPMSLRLFEFWSICHSVAAKSRQIFMFR